MEAPVDIRFQKAPVEQWQANTIIAFGFKNEDLRERMPSIMEAAPWVDITPAMQDFKGEANQVVVMYGHPEIPLPRLIAVGLGERDAFTIDALRHAAGTALLKCRELKVDTCAIPVEIFADIDADTEALVEEAVYAALISLYSYDELKTQQKEVPHTPRWLALLSAEEQFPDAQHKAARRGEAAAAGVSYARNLGNGPGNIVTPSYLAEKAEELGKEYAFTTQIIDRKELAEMGMGAFESVFKGSEEDAKLVVIEHAPKGTEDDKPIVFVGKGVTFDTGGISLKPSAKMHEMKCDMGGAGAIFGLFKALGASDINRRVVGIMPCTDNMPDGRATRPGDVVKSYSGKTIEITNTDAEGRLILCDAITWAQKEYEPEVLIDLATLTGACVVTFGHETAAVFATDTDLSEQIQAVGQRVGDRFWPLPLWDFYFEGMKSEVADMMNAGPREAGTINAALFLKQFVEKDTRWAHLDIAGPAFGAKKTPIYAAGATGFAVRTLLELARNGIHKAE